MASLQTLISRITLSSIDKSFGPVWKPQNPELLPLLPHDPVIANSAQSLTIDTKEIELALDPTDSSFGANPKVLLTDHLDYILRTPSTHLDHLV